MVDVLVSGPRIRANLIVKLMLINVAVIGIAMLAVWLSIDILAADYATRLMREFNILPARTHWVFLSTVHRYLMWSAIVALSLAITFSLLLTRRVLSPLAQMRKVAGKIAAGDYSQRITVTSHDEIADLAADLNAMADSLQKIEQLRQDMVADVAHELRTPLTNMRGYIEGLIDGVVPASPDQFRLLHEETLRLVTLVDDLLRLADADASNVTTPSERVALAPLVDNVLRLVTPDDEDRTLAIPTDIPEGLAVRGDPDKLLQVFHNLIDNAVRYGTPGAPVEIAAKQVDRETVAITVRNRWDGGDDGDFELNFERFRRSEKSRSRRYGGAGIGLAIVRQLVESQHGHVSATARGGFVTIDVRLPNAKRADGSEKGREFSSQKP